MSDHSGSTTESRAALSRRIDRVYGQRNGLPPETTDFTVTRNVRIPTRDGVELAADLYLPTSTPVGTLLVRGPYGRSFMMAMPMARIFAARGYAALFVSSRGTAGSGGALDPMRTEAEDGHDVVAWLRDQPWFTGTFATLGGSYLGHTQWALMTDPPPEHVAAVVSVGPHDFHRHAWGAGAFKLDFLGWSHMVCSMHRGALPFAWKFVSSRRALSRAMDGIPLTTSGRALLRQDAPWYEDWVTRPAGDDPFWAPMQHGAALERTQVPVLLVTGWRDLFLEQAIAQYRRLRERGLDVALTVGDWTHTQVGGREATIDTWDWLEAHLAQRRPAVQRAGRVRVFETGSGTWRTLADWPPATVERAMFPARDGALLDDRPTGAVDVSFTYDPTDPTPTVGGPLLFGRGRVDDSRLAERSDVLAFTSAPLTARLVVAGAPAVELAHRTDNPHADLFVRVSEVTADGKSRNLTEGYVRLDPNRGDEPVTVVMHDLFHRFAVGARVRLMVAGGSHPQLARNLGTGENPGSGARMAPSRHTVVAGTSTLVLPVVTDPIDG